MDMDTCADAHDDRSLATRLRADRHITPSLSPILSSV